VHIKFSFIVSLFSEEIYSQTTEITTQFRLKY